MADPLYNPIPGLFGTITEEAPDEISEEEREALFQERGQALVERGGKLFRRKQERVNYAHDRFSETPESAEGATTPPVDYAPPVDPLIGAPIGFDARFGDDLIAQNLTLPSTEVKPDSETGEPNRIKDTINFLFGDDMAILGMKWDEQGLNLAYDTALEQWSEHPVMSSISALGLAASFAFPAIGALRKSAKVGLLAQKGLAPSYSILRTGGEATFRRADEIRSMAREVNEIGKPRFWSPKDTEKILSATDDKLEKMISNRDVKRMLLADDHMRRYLRLKEKVETGIASRAEEFNYNLRGYFQNGWFQMLHSPTREYINSLDDFYATSGIGRFLLTAPDPKHGNSIYKYLAGIFDEKQLRKAGLDDDGVAWARTMSEEMTVHQKKMLDEGFITQAEFDTFKPFGKRHLPALHRDTPGAIDFSSEQTILKAIGEKGAVKPVRRRRLGKLLAAPQLKQRRKYLTHEDVLQDLNKFITDPTELTLAGIAKDKQLYHGFAFLRDMGLQAGKEGPLSVYVKSSDQILQMSKVAQKNWISLDDINVPGAADRVRRMMEAKLGERVSGRLPFVHKRLVDDFFGSSGYIAQSQNAASALEIMTSIHKTARTALNPATHMQNLVGNLFGFLPMAGYNLLNPLKAGARLNEGRMLSRSFIDAARQINPKNKAFAKDVREVFEYENLKKIFTKHNGTHMMKTKWGSDLDLAEMFSNKIMLSTMEESAFDSVEGFTHVKKALDRLNQLEERGGFAFGPGSALAKKIADVFTRVGEGGIRERALHTASSAYLGEDVVPKMMYALDLAKDGLSIDQVVLEVGRRLPQYQAVGSAIGHGRKMMLPWITFPAEAMRIMKNNIQDYPVRMMAWLQIPHILQGFASNTGIGPRPEELDELRKGAPQWADKPSAVFLREEAAGPVLGGVTGAAAGGAVGTILGGAPGAALGTLAGAGAGVAVGMQAPDEHEERIRSWVMDFLPHSSVMPGTTSEYVEPMTNAWALATDVSPVEPFAVVMPLLQAATGRGSFGQEIRSTGLLESASKGALGLLGFLSPPWLQKYGMKVEGPGGVYVPMADAQEDLGGHAVVPRGILGAAAGIGTGLLAKKAGLGLPTSAVLGGVAGMAGSRMNTRRLMQDTGAMGNPYTKEPGNPIFDMLFNTFGGLPKSWEVSPKQRLVNENFRSRKFTEIRTSLTKQLDDSVENRATGETNRMLERIYKSFLTEHVDPSRAQRKFLEWEKRHVDVIGRIPALRGLSKEELLRRLVEASDFAEKHRSAHAKRMVQLIQQELLTRRIGRMGRGSTRKRGAIKAKRYTF
jgi:hypothetical protein